MSTTRRGLYSPCARASASGPTPQSTRAPAGRCRSTARTYVAERQIRAGDTEQTSGVEQTISAADGENGQRLCEPLVDLDQPFIAGYVTIPHISGPLKNLPDTRSVSEPAK